MIKLWVYLRYMIGILRIRKKSMNRFYLGLLLIIATQVCSAQTWVRQNGPTGGAVTDIEFDVTNSKVYAIVNNRLYVSADDGANWARITGTLANFFINDVEVSGNTVYVTDGYDVFTSTGGAAFTKKNTDFVLSGASKMKQYGTNSLVAVATNRVYYSTNGGTTWSQGAAPSSGSWVVNSLAVNNVDQIFLVNTNTYLPLRSTDGGISFSSPTNTLLVGPVHYMTSNNDKSLIYAVTSANVYSSSNGNSWASIRSGIPLTDITISPSVSTPSLLEFSADGLGMYFVDNNNFKSYTKTLAAASWTQSSAFPGTNLVVNCVSAKTYAAASTSVAAFGTNPGVHRTTNGGAVINESNTGLNGTSSYQMVHASNGNMLLNSSGVGLYQSTNSGANWTRQTNIPTNVAWLSAASTTNTGLNQTQLALRGFPDYNFYSSANGGTSWTTQTTPVNLEWMQGTDYDRVFGLSAVNVASFYFSYNKGATGTWSGVIPISGLPSSYTVWGTGRLSVYSSSTTSATMFLELYNSSIAIPAYEQWKIVFMIGSTTTISGIATKITNIPIANIDKMMAVNGKLYAFSDNTNPDQYAYSSNAGTSWTTRTSPASEGDMFVARNGYVFLTSESPKKLYMSRDDGLTFIETTIPATVEPFNINEIVIDLYDHGVILSNQEFVHRTSAIIVTPLAPTNATVLGVTANAVSIRWDDNATNEGVYNIERSSDGGTTYSIVGSVFYNDICGSVAPYQGYFVDGGLAANTSYIYRVSAVNDAGSSAKLTFAPVTTLAGSTANIPDNRSWTATNAGGGGYAPASLSPVGIRSLGGNKYEVSDMGMRLFSGSDYKETFFESNGTTLVAPTNTNYTIVNNGTGTWNSTTNVLTVKWKHCSNGNFETITFTLNSLASDPTPSAPTGVQALVAATSQIEISWTSGFYEKDYIVERSPNGTSGFVQVGSNVNYPTTKITDNSALVEGTTYYYRVRSRNANNVSSPNSSVISIVYRKPYFTLPANTINSTSMVSLGSYWGDYNNDGNEDVLFMRDPFSSYGAPVIYENDGLGNFTAHNVTVSDERYLVASVADFNNDGFPDLAMGIDEKPQFDLYYGNGDFTFTKLNTGQLGDIATSITTAILSSSWADINNDGRLDLIALPQENGSPLLFKQTSTGSFVKIGGGDLASDTGGGITPLLADYNADGFTDLLIVSQSGAWRLFQNNQDETFTNRTSTAGIDASQGVSASWGDFNSDGHLDLYAGTATVAQPLYRNNGDGTFAKITTSSVSEVTTSYGSTWGDFNNDGLLDLLTTGVFNFPTRLFINTTSGSSPTFTKITSEKINDLGTSHYGGASGDFNNDGYTDVVLSTFNLVGSELNPALGNAFRNNQNVSSTSNWSKVKLVGVASNKSGIGAQVRLVSPGKTQVREVQALSSFAAQNSLIQHFGIGSSSSITSIQVRWPSGLVQTYVSPPINQLLTIVEDGTGPAVTLLSPAAGATGVGLSSSVEITFDEPVVRNFSKEIRVTRVSDGALIFHQSVGTGVQNGNKYTFTFGAPMVQSTQYEVTFEAGAITDVYGNALAAFTTPWRFTTIDGPQITALSPLNSAVNVPSNTTISITFNIPTTGVAGKKLVIYRNSDLVTPVLSFDATAAVADGNKRTFTISPNLPTETALTVSIEAGAFKDAGNALSASAQWSFTTMPPPKFTALVPADEATGVAANTTLEITFDKPVTAEAGRKFRVYKSSEANPVFESDVTSGTIAGNKVTFVISPKLAGQSNYSVFVDGFSFKDATGNLFTGIGATQWNFRTDQGPSITGYSPAHGATNVSTTSAIELTFNRPLVSAVAGKKIQVLDGATVVADVNVAVSGTIAGSKYTLPAPSGQWPAGKLLTVALDVGAFVDAGGNDSDGLAGGLYSFTTEVGPVIVSLLPTSGATGIAPNTALEITFDKNVTAVANKKINIMDGATTVVSSNVSAVGTIAGAKYTYPAPTGGWPLDKVLTVLVDDGAFIDIGAKPSPGISGAQWTFRTIVAPDATPPSITFQPATADKSSLPVSFTASITDNVGVQGSKLFIRPVSGGSFTEVTASGPTGTNVYTYALTGAMFDNIGAQYYITATDASGNSARSPETGHHHTYLKYNTASSVIPSGLVGTGGTKQGWKVIAVPFELGNNNAVSSVFDELFNTTPALTYKKDWRLVVLSQTPSLRWVDYNEGFTNIDRGTGYLINVKVAKALSIGNDLTAPVNARDNLFKYTLKAGWNMIGNPYLTRINWANVVAYNNLQGTAQIFKKISNGNYVDNGLVEAFEGGFVQVATQMEITIPFEGQVAVGGRERQITFEEGDWVLPITLKHKGFENTFGGVGMHRQSTGSFDALDNFNGPQFMDFIEMNFDHPNDFPKKFSRDVVSRADEYVWDFTVDASGEGLATMDWDASDALAGSNEIYLWDESLQVAINMKEESYYEFDPRFSRRFRIFFGKDARSKIRPERSLLGHPYPNPSLGISYIPFALPEGKPEFGVKIEVFDVMGRKVTTLEDGFFVPGLHKTQWDGHESPAGSGLYTVRMTVVTEGKQEVYNDKIVLNK